MTLTDAVRERLTPEVLSEVRDMAALGHPYGLSREVILAALTPVLEQAQRELDARVKCDGNHGGPRCADPECWNDEADPGGGS